MKFETYNDYMSRIYPDDLPLKSVTFQVTDDCNLCCTYCYQHNKGHHIMPLDIAKKFIDLILSDECDYINTSNTGGLIIDLIGGEPLLEVDLIDDIATYLFDEMIKKNHPWLKKTKLSMISNGVLYFNKNVQHFLKKWGDLLSFAVSIDGDKRLHDACRVFPNGTGSYDVAIAAAKDWMSKEYYMGSKVTISPDNVMYVCEAVISLINNGYDTVNINCIFEEGWTVNHAKTLYTQLKQLADYLLEHDAQVYVSMFETSIGFPLEPSDDRNWCGGTGVMLSVDYKGDIYPCVRYMESSLGGHREPLIIGNVWDGIAKKQCEQDCVKCLQAITRHSQSTEECLNCPISAGCAWCSAYNYEKFGTANKRATFICEMHKARTLANVYYWNQLYRKQGASDRYQNYCPDDWALRIISKDELKMLKDLAKED